MPWNATRALQDTQQQRCCVISRTKTKEGERRAAMLRSIDRAMMKAVPRAVGRVPSNHDRLPGVHGCTAVLLMRTAAFALLSLLSAIRVYFWCSGTKTVLVLVYGVHSSSSSQFYLVPRVKLDCCASQQASEGNNQAL